jgi:hypothetical protein
VNAWVLGTGGLPTTAFLLDEVAPVVTLFDVTPAFICAGSASPACYVNGAFLFASDGGPFYSDIDGGVSAGPTKLPTQVFAAGLPGAEVTVTSGADMAESATALTYVIKVTTTDALGNSRTVWAGVVNTTPTTSATSASTQKFGIDKTNPTHVLTTVANAAVNLLPAASSAAYTDAGVGPSGFLANPVRIKIQRINVAGTTCRHPDTGAQLAGSGGGCTTNSGFVADDGIFTFLTAGPIPDAYYVISVYVIDQAGNVSATQTIEVLNDVTAPSFTGGITAQATIAGGAAAIFSSALADAVDLGSLEPYVGYGAGAYFIAAPRQAIGDGAFGSATLVGTDAGAVTIPNFVRSLENNNGAGLPSGVLNPGTSITYAVRDMAGHQLRFVLAPWAAAPNDGVCPTAAYPDLGSTTQNCSTRQLDITPNVAAPVGGVFTSGYTALVTANGLNALHGLFVQAAPSNLVACNSAATTTAFCTTATNDNLVTLTVTVTGPVSVFTSPFTGVQFYYLDGEGKWQPAGPAAGAPSITDNTVTSTRTITYTAVWNVADPKVRPGTLAGTVYNVVAIGQNAAGDGLASTVQTVTVQGN